eukprot:15190734-Alexandrium_andersonii.AAC.1
MSRFAWRRCARLSARMRVPVLASVSVIAVAVAAAVAVSAVCHTCVRLKQPHRIGECADVHDAVAAAVAVAAALA